MDSETVEEIKRHFGVVAEGLRSDIRAVAEGQVLLVERVGTLDRKVDALDRKVDVLDRRVEALDRRVDGIADVVQRTYSEVTGA